MLRNLVVATCLLALASGPSLATEETTKASTTLDIKGMTCGGCVAAVKVALKKTEGVEAYDVSLEKNEADVQFDPSKTDAEKIAAAVSKTGFKASVKSKDEDSQKK